MVTCDPTEEVGRVTSDHQKKDSGRGVFERAGPQKQHQRVTCDPTQQGRWGHKRPKGR